MLTRLDDFDNLTDNRQWPIAAIISVGIFVLLAAAITTTAVRTTERQTVDFEKLGEVLFTQWAIPFEVASLVLLVALIGSIILVKVDGDRD
jgi:NADH-quinone oxidoreductase subunit J